VNQTASTPRSAARGAAYVPSDLATSSTRPRSGSASPTRARTQAVVCSSVSCAGGSHQTCRTDQPCSTSATPAKNSNGATAG
jgi:hypothetical protein